MMNMRKTRREALMLGAAAAFTGFASEAQQRIPSQLDLEPGSQPARDPKSTGIQPVRYEQDASGRDANHPVWDPFKVIAASTHGALFAFENTALITPIAIMKPRNLASIGHKGTLPAAIGTISKANEARVA